MDVSFSELSNTSRKKQAHRVGGPDLKPISFIYYWAAGAGAVGAAGVLLTSIGSR